MQNDIHEVLWQTLKDLKSEKLSVKEAKVVVEVARLIIKLESETYLGLGNRKELLSRTITAEQDLQTGIIS